MVKQGLSMYFKRDLYIKRLFDFLRLIYLMQETWPGLCPWCKCSCEISFLQVIECWCKPALRVTLHPWYIASHLSIFFMKHSFQFWPTQYDAFLCYIAFEILWPTIYQNVSLRLKEPAERRLRICYMGQKQVHNCLHLCTSNTSSFLSGNIKVSRYISAGLGFKCMLYLLNAG